MITLQQSIIHSSTSISFN